MVLGLDVSTAVVGYCVLDSNGTIVELDYVNLKKFKTLCSKSSNLITALRSINEKHKITEVYIEECLQRFSYGRSSAATITKLASFNGIVQYLSYDTYGIEPKLLNAMTARKLLGIKTQSKKKSGKDVKQQVFEWVTHYLDMSWPTKILKGGPRKGTEVLKEEAYDMADAWVIAKAALNSINVVN